MPFLFVDYDQGAGGEYFCQSLSMSPQCVKLSGFRNQLKRTKVNDVFGQEFLKSYPEPKYKASHNTLYDIVPTHRFTQLAQDLLGEIVSIRIANPIDRVLWNYLKYQQITKVFLSPLPSADHFIGELEMLKRGTPDQSWLKHVNSKMDNLSLILLSKGVQPTDKNKEYFINKIAGLYLPEPEYPYTLVIPYEDLFYNTKSIVENIKSKFNIDTDETWLATLVFRWWLFEHCVHCSVGRSICVRFFVWRR